MEILSKFTGDSAKNYKNGNPKSILMLTLLQVALNLFSFRSANQAHRNLDRANS